MKVLIVTASYPPLKNGTSRLMGNLADSLSSRGSAVTVLTRRTQNLRPRERENGVDIFRVDSSASLFGKISFMIKSSALVAISTARSRVEVIHAVGTVALASSVIGSLGRTAIIATFPGLPEETVRSGDPQRVVKSRARAVLRILSLFPRYATVPTSQAWGPVAELAGERLAKTMTVVSNPIDLKAFSPSGRPRSEGYFPEILAVGGLRSRKGVGTLIEVLPTVLKSCPRARLTLIGTGSFAPALRDLAQGLGVEASLRWTGEVSDDDLIAYYEGSDLVVVPSLAGGEAFGYVVAEAMCMKKPVIASATPGPSELIKEADCGLLFPPGDSDQLASMIMALAKDENRRRTFGENGRRYAELHFDATKVVAQYEHLYRMAIGDGLLQV